MLDTAALDALPGKLKTQLDAVVRKTAFDVQAAAQLAVPRDTGAAANSIYTIVGEENGYAAAVAAVEAAAPGTTMQDEVKPADAGPSVDGPSAVVAVGVEYGAYLEFGTVRMPARPFLTPAVALAETSFLAACGAAVGQAATGGVVTRSVLDKAE